MTAGQSEVTADSIRTKSIRAILNFKMIVVGDPSPPDFVAEAPISLILSLIREDFDRMS